MFEPPINMGYPMRSYAIIHPTLHTSVAQSYSCDPSNIYGERYHLVATSSDKISFALSSLVNDLTNPKSHNLI